MWNCRWLLCLVVIGVAALQVSSMNEQSRSKNDYLVPNTNSEGKNKPRDEPTPRERDQAVFQSPGSIAAADIAANSTSSNGTVALVGDAGASTSTNAAAKLSRSKRYFHRSKLYREDSRPKSRASIKSIVASGNLIRFSTGLHNSDRNSDGIELVASTSRTPNATKTRAAPSHDESIPTTSSGSFTMSPGSKNASDAKWDELSSRMTAGSENWDNSSTSSDSGSIIDEKSSSVELMAFTFESVEEMHQPTLPNDLEDRLENLTRSFASNVVDRPSSTTIEKAQTSVRSIDKSKSTAADPTNARTDRSQSIKTAKSGFNDDAVIYSVHTEKSRDRERRTNEVSTSTRRDGDNMTKDDSVILASVASESSASKKSMNGSSTEGRTDNESNATNFGNNLNQRRPDADGYSWVSINDSLNRISLTEVANTLKTVASRESRGSNSYSNSTVPTHTGSSSEPKNGDRAESAKHSRSLNPVPEVAQNPREPRPSTSSEPGIKLADHSHASLSVSKFDHLLKLTIPSNLEAIGKPQTKNDFAAEEIGLLRTSTSVDSSPKKRSSEEKDSGRRDQPFKLVLDLDPSPSQCSSSSSTERSSHVRRRDDENPFHQPRRGDVTLAIKGNGISETSQCLTRISSAQTPSEAIVSPVIPSNPEEREVDVTVPANRSHVREAEDTKSSLGAIEENRGGQSSLSPGMIILENFEPVVPESLASGEAVAPVETETTTAGHFFAAFPDPEEHCDVASFNVFIPSVNSRETGVANIVSEEEPPLVHRPVEAQLNSTTTEDSIYIMEGFGFFKNNPDEAAEIEDEFDRGRDASFDYAETEVFPGYPQLDDHPPAPALKLIDQIDFEAELPVKQEHLIAAGVRWKEKTGGENYEQWWLNDRSKRRGQAMKNDDLDQRTVLILNAFATPREVPVVQSFPDDVLPQVDESDHNSYRIFLLPTVYVFIGICIVVMGCSIWCSRISVKRQPSLPKLTYFIQQRRGAAETV